MLDLSSITRLLSFINLSSSSLKTNPLSFDILSIKILMDFSPSSKFFNPVIETAPLLNNLILLYLFLNGCTIIVI